MRDEHGVPMLVLPPYWFARWELNRLERVDGLAIALPNPQTWGIDLRGGCPFVAEVVRQTEEGLLRVQSPLGAQSLSAALEEADRAFPLPEWWTSPVNKVGQHPLEVNDPDRWRWFCTKVYVQVTREPDGEGIWAPREHHYDNIRVGDRRRRGKPGWEALEEEGVQMHPARPGRDIEGRP